MKKTAPTPLAAVLMVALAMLAIQLSAPMMKSLFPIIGVYGALLGRASSGFLIFQLLRPGIWRTFRFDSFHLYLLYGLLLAGKGLCMFNAMKFQSVGVVMTIDFLGPLGVTIFVALRNRDYSVVPLALLAMTGLAMVTGLFTDSFHQDAHALLGVLLAIGSALCGGFFVPVNRLINRVHPDQGGNVIGGLFSLTVMAIAAVILGGNGPDLRLDNITLPVLGVMLLTGLVGNTTPVLLQSIALHSLSTDIMSCLRALSPVFALLVGSVLLHEHVTLQQLLGTLLILVASVLLTVKAIPGIDIRAFLSGRLRQV